MSQVDKRSTDGEAAFNSRNAAKNTAAAKSAESTRAANDRAKDALDAKSFARQGSHGWRPVK